MRTVGEHGDDETFGVRADRVRPPLEALRRPSGVASMRARHVVRIGAMTRAAVATLMGGDALGVMEHLDDAAGDAHTGWCWRQGATALGRDAESSAWRNCMTFRGFSHRLRPSTR